MDDHLGWEEEKEMERLACEGDDFIPPKIMVRDGRCTDPQILNRTFQMRPPDMCSQQVRVKDLGDPWWPADVSLVNSSPATLATSSNSFDALPITLMKFPFLEMLLLQMCVSMCVYTDI